MTIDSTARGGALAGIRVLDLSSVMMGPAATKALCDMGADVIKIESPEGDILRHVGPGRNPGMGAIFLQTNSGKRSLVLDLKRPQGRECVLNLARSADVLIYNIRPQAMQRLGLTYEEVACANPRIVYAGLLGFDQRGPYAARPAYDDLIQSMAALPTLSTMAGGDRPRYVPIALADRYVAAVAVGVIVAAVCHSQRTGRGQRVDVPMFETMAQLVLSEHLGGQTFEPPLGPCGYKRTTSPGRVPFATSDGYISVLAYTDSHWRSVFRIAGNSLESDPRFSHIAQRTLHIDELYGALAALLMQRTTAEWMELLLEADVPATPLHTLESLVKDPHLAEVDFFTQVEHPTEGWMTRIGPVSRWSGTPAASHGHAPGLGEHSISVLQEAGYSEQEIELLLKEGVTFDGARSRADTDL